MGPRLSKHHKAWSTGKISYDQIVMYIKIISNESVQL